MTITTQQQIDEAAAKLEAERLAKLAQERKDFRALQAANPILAARELAARGYPLHLLNDPPEGPEAA